MLLGSKAKGDSVIVWDPDYEGKVLDASDKPYPSNCKDERIDKIAMDEILSHLPEVDYELCMITLLFFEKIFIKY